MSDSFKITVLKIFAGMLAGLGVASFVFLVLEMSLENINAIHVVSIFVLYIFIIGVVFQLYKLVSKLSNYVEKNDERIEHINKESLVLTYVWSTSLMMMLSIFLHLNGFEKIGLGMSLSIPITFLIYLLSFELMKRKY